MGKARSLRDRVSSYFSNNLLPKTAALVYEIKKIDHIVVESEVDALILEASLIKKYLPKYNLLGKDGKSFPYIEIGKEIKIVHQKKNKRFKYFGPYPPGSNIRYLLRFLKIQLNVFPFLPKEEYQNNLKKLINFLSGKRKLVQKQLHREMLQYARVQNFEEAGKIKERILQIEYLTSSKYAPWQYEQNPNLVEDRRNNEITQLQALLGLKKLEKIECFDISNISGKNATGAQVTFVNGQPEKKFYRRYKIRLQNGPNDVAMMKEMVARRLKSDVALPDLFVIDGGKEHLFPVPIPIIGLAKRLETIIYKGKEIQLPLNSPALHLLQRLRDEAHRFSQKYHFLLRSKKMLE